MATNTAHEGSRTGGETGNTDELAGAFGYARTLVWEQTGLLDRYVFPRLEALAFWFAVALPWGLLVLSFVGVPSQYPGSFTALLSMNLVCAVAGHRHGRGSDGAR